MPESPEHKYVGECFNDIVREFSRLDLYTYQNVDRQRFDFACTIEQTLSRAVVGQTLWGHDSGIEKDLRTLIFDVTAEIKVYLVRGRAATTRRVDATIDDFRGTGVFDNDAFRFVRLDYPDFDADDESERESVRRALRDGISERLLFRVVFGGLSARDIRFLLHVGNIDFQDVAYNLRLLHYIRAGRFVSYRGTAQDLRTNANKVRERRHILFGADLIRPDGGDLVVTESGETFLRLLDRLGAESRQGAVTPELSYLFDKIGCPFADLLGTTVGKPDESLRPIRLLSLALTLNDFNDEWRIDLGALARAAVTTRPELEPRAVTLGLL